MEFYGTARPESTRRRDRTLPVPLAANSRFSDEFDIERNAKCGNIQVSGHRSIFTGKFYRRAPPVNGEYASFTDMRQRATPRGQRP